MSTVKEQILSADKVICQNISMLSEQRGLLSNNILSQLRNLVEGIIVLFHTGSMDIQFQYDGVKPALAAIKSKGQLRILTKFHKLLQISVSHYTVDGDNPDRLMLKYYEYLIRIRELVHNQVGLNILYNLEHFPVDLDPSLREYHEKIALNIDDSLPRPSKVTTARYYIHKTKPFFYKGKIYYEVTFYRAVNKANKFNRIIAFTDIEIADKHAVSLSLQTDTISVLGQNMPITIIRNSETSIRPCEFNNFANLLGISVKVRTDSHEYHHLMTSINTHWEHLLNVVTASNEAYQTIRTEALKNIKSPQIFPVLDKARQIILDNLKGKNVLRYLLLRMNNQIIKNQRSSDKCHLLSNLNLKFGCIPFERMPFCTSLIGHNPRFVDVFESIEVENRNHEMIARKVRNNIENHGILYTPISDFSETLELDNLINRYNQLLYRKHGHRSLCMDKGHIFISGYEDDTALIIQKLQEFTESGVAGYSQAVIRWLNETPSGIDDPLKKDALVKLFKHSKVALIYGAAGTGKSTIVHHIAQYFSAKNKLFLAHTNPAVDNLERRVNTQNSTFRTIRKQINSNNPFEHFELLIIDECSTVSNEDILKVIENTSFQLLILVGDVYQIESIQFGNWFGMASSFIPNASIFELKTPYRATNKSLLKFWDTVRNNNDPITELIVKNGYSTELDSSLFESHSPDEIILCLNYDGLYGINNINRFLQSGNKGLATIWKESTFKVGDPVLFSDSERFRPVIYNNLKGWIMAIEKAPGWIQFDIKLDRHLNELDVSACEDLEWVQDSIVRFTVYDYPEASDEDDDQYNTSIPFQVAYAVSIHKAQGLEYNSVKIVITDANEDEMSHSIFYTAITRTQEHLKIFWTPETMQKVLKSFHRMTGSKDTALIKSRKTLLTMD